MRLDSDIWGPKYWFVLHTISLTYPKNPPERIKKIYYRFIQDLPLFLPDETISNDFNKLLNKYPVTPYLDNKESFIRWVHFIHNKINKSLGKKEISLSNFLNNYYKNYKPKSVIIKEEIKQRKKYIYLGIVIMIFGAIYYLKDK